MRAPTRKFLLIAAAAITLASAAAVIYLFALPRAERASRTTPRTHEPASRERPLPPLNDDAVERGRKIYLSKCAACHKADASGDPDWKTQHPDGTFPPPPHDSSGHTWHHPDGLLFRIVRDGGKAFEDPGFKSAMPAFGDRLDDREILAVITYLKSLWGPEERAFQLEVSKKDPFPKGAAAEAAP